MTVLYFDCYAGISGDMTVGALLDLGVPLEHLQTELAGLGLPEGSYNISIRRTERCHMPALKFDVTINDHHTHRHYAGIDAMIAASRLAEPVKDRARSIFSRLAEAEAKVHGVPVAEVHFHEVGAVDSIIDIVGTAICLEYLDVEKIFVSPLPLGGGFVETAHGRLPVPAPATAELLQGMALHSNCGEGERVTPTGAAIVAALAVSGSMPQMNLLKIGCGAGGKDFPDCPNILRALLGNAKVVKQTADEVIVASTNIDDSTPEILGFAMERLFEEGALDVFFTPIQMKKNRPAVMLSFLCRTEQLDALAKLVLKETSAIGLRYHTASRIILNRSIEKRITRFGPMHFKQLFDEDGILLREAPEYEDCHRVAHEMNIPCREVMAEVMAAGDSGKIGESLDVALAKQLREQGRTLALAESCTGGMIAQRITAIPGSSAYFIEGFVTYSNSAKIKLLGVAAELLDSKGAVSEECAQAMAVGVRNLAGSDLGLAVTGIAGPDGGSDEKPLGTVFISLADPNGCRTERFLFKGNRGNIRLQTADTALNWLHCHLKI